MTPEELLKIHEELRESANGDALEKRWGIYDNFPVLLYGEEFPLYKTLFDAFLNSPRQDGLHDKWIIDTRQARLAMILEYLSRNQIISSPHFYYDPGTASVVFHQTGETHAFRRAEYHLGGKPSSLWLSFHPYNPKKMEGVHGRVGLASGIADFVQYVAKNDIAARFLRFEGIDVL